MILLIRNLMKIYPNFKFISHFVRNTSDFKLKMLFSTCGTLLHSFPFEVGNFCKAPFSKVCKGDRIRRARFLEISVLKDATPIHQHIPYPFEKKKLPRKTLFV